MKFIFILTIFYFMSSIAQAKNPPLQNPKNPPRSTAANSDEPLIDIKSINPSIEVEMRYLTDWNFLGRSVVGYNANKCLLTKEAAFALDKVQQEAGRLGLSLLVFDCYRPQKSVTEFAHWAQDLKDEKMKSIFYPDEPKNKLFERGYIAKSSGHSRGSTIDLTLVKTLVKNLKTSTTVPLKFKETKLLDCRDTKNIEATNQLDMGTSFDCFSTLSNTANPNISKLAAENRRVLKNMMEKFGFVNYSKEWWHYTLKKEPSKNQYYDFDIR